MNRYNSLAIFDKRVYYICLEFKVEKSISTLTVKEFKGLYQGKRNESSSFKFRLWQKV